MTVAERDIQLKYFVADKTKIFPPAVCRSIEETGIPPSPLLVHLPENIATPKYDDKLPQVTLAEWIKYFEHPIFWILYVPVGFTAIVAALSFTYGINRFLTKLFRKPNN